MYLLPLPPYEDRASDRSPAKYNSPFPPLYDYGSGYGISDEIDKVLMGRAPVDFLETCEEIQSRLEQIDYHISHLAALRNTSVVLKQFFSSMSEDRHDLLATISELSYISRTFVRTISSSPHHCFLLAVETHSTREERKKAEHLVFGDILRSLLQATKAVILILKKRFIETPESVETELSIPGGFGIFLALGMLFEAYGSRLAPPDTLYLVSGRILRKNHCYGAALIYFMEVCKLRKLLPLIPERTPHLPGPETEVWGRLLEETLPILKHTRSGTNFTVERYSKGDDGCSPLIYILGNAMRTLPGMMNNVG